MNPARRTTAAASTAVVLATAGGLLTAAAAPASAAVTCTSPVYKRQFFANTSFSGTAKKTDCDSAIDQNWGSGAPASGLPKDKFGVRWTVTRDFGSGGPFKLSASAQDGIRVYLDGKIKIDHWKNVSSTVKKSADVTIPNDGKKHTLRVDYANFTGTANVKFTYTPRTSADVDKVKPLVPTGTSATYDPASGNAKLTWAKNKEMDLAGYRIYRRLKGSSFGSTPLATTTSTSYTDTTLPKTGATYYYELRARDKAGNVSAGTADQGVTTVDTTAPATPAGVEGNGATGPVTEAQLSWDANTESDLAGYRVYRRYENGQFSTPLATTTSTSYTDTPPPTGSTYYYEVRAFDKAGNESAGSADQGFTSVDTTAPAAPNELEVRGYEQHVSLDWYGSSNGHWHKVYRATSPNGPFTRIADVTSGNYYNDTTAVAETVYYYRVTALDLAGNESEPSITVNGQLADVTPPAPVTGLTATPTEYGFELNWDASPAADLINYVFRRGVPAADGSCTFSAGSVYLSVTTTSYKYAVLPDGRKSCFLIDVVDDAYNVTYRDTGVGEVVTATRLDTRPSVATPEGSPLTLTATVATGDEGNKLAWFGQDDSAGGFRVYRWNPDTSAYEKVTDVAPGVFEYYDTGARRGTASYYWVTAVAADGTESLPAGDWVVTAPTA